MSFNIFNSNKNAIDSKLQEISEKLPVNAEEITTPFPEEPIKLQAAQREELKKISNGQDKSVLPMDSMSYFPPNPIEALKVALGKNEAKEYAKKVLVQEQISRTKNPEIKKAYKKFRLDKQKVNSVAFKNGFDSARDAVKQGGQAFLAFASAERSFRAYFPLNIVFGVIASQEMAASAVRSGIGTADTLVQRNTLSAKNALKFQHTAKIAQIKDVLTASNLSQDDKDALMSNIYELSDMYKKSIKDIDNGAPARRVLNRFSEVSEKCFSNIKNIMPEETMDTVRIVLGVGEEMQMRRAETELKHERNKEELERMLQESERPEIVQSAIDAETEKFKNINLESKKNKLEQLFAIDAPEEMVNYQRMEARFRQENAEKIHKMHRPRPKQPQINYQFANAPMKIDSRAKTKLSGEEILKCESKLSPQTLSIWKTNYVNSDAEFNTKRRLIETRSDYLNNILAQNTDEAKALSKLLRDGETDNFVYVKTPDESNHKADKSVNRSFTINDKSNSVSKVNDKDVFIG